MRWWDRHFPLSFSFSRLLVQLVSVITFVMSWRRQLLCRNWHQTRRRCSLRLPSFLSFLSLFPSSGETACVVSLSSIKKWKEEGNFILSLSCLDIFLLCIFLLPTCWLLLCIQWSVLWKTNFRSYTDKDGEEMEWTKRPEDERDGEMERKSAGGKGSGENAVFGSQQEISTNWEDKSPFKKK